MCNSLFYLRISLCKVDLIPPKFLFLFLFCFISLKKKNGTKYALVFMFLKCNAFLFFLFVCGKEQEKIKDRSKLFRRI